MLTDKEKLDLLRDLMGYVENGTSTTVSFFQDDVTKLFFLKIGKDTIKANTFNDLFFAAKEYLE